ncbi:MAG: hypothetical protein GQ569_04110 [Methylococcaceae bacterium]|nr:hypothetical protein [Methylococcaceae bacterium]
MYTETYQVPLNADNNETESTPKSQSLTAKISNYLRWAGTLLIILSAISFMLQGHENMLPSYRYWIALGFTSLLCGGGLICAYVFNETKGARIFFGLGTAFLTVQTSQVGSMIYAYLNGQQALQPKYAWLQFIDVSPTVIALDLGLTAVLLVIVSYAGFSILARKHLKLLLSAFVISNALLMLPIREAHSIAATIGGLFLFLRYIEQQLHQDRTMQLLEGLAARLIISLPLFIMIGRSLLHPASFLLAVIGGAIIATYLLCDIKRYTQSAMILYIGQLIGTISALSVWLIIVDEFFNDVQGLALLMLPLAMVLFGLSFVVSYHAKLYRFVSSLLAVFLTYEAMVDGLDFAPIFALITGMALTVSGLKTREKVPFFTGHICFASGFLFYCRYAVDLYSAAPWLSAIALGLFVILFSSYLESREKKIVQKFKLYFHELKSWA